MFRLTRPVRSVILLAGSLLLISSLRTLLGLNVSTYAPVILGKKLVVLGDTGERLATKYPLLKFLSKDRDNADEAMLSAIREMMSHAWDSYTSYAPLADELRPMARLPYNWYWADSLLSTPVDALDTLHIMGLKSQYEDAKKMVLERLDFDAVAADVSVFETTIRILGGLLAAFELDGDDKLLDKAVDLADRLLGAFETPTGFPVASWKLEKGAKPRNLGGRVNLAEIGTLQLEFQYLSDITGNPIYAEKALAIIDTLHAVPKPIPGLYPIEWQVSSVSPPNPRGGELYGIGAASDSFYEYLLKMWLATGEAKYRDMYNEAADAIATHLVRTSTDGKYTFVPDARRYSDGLYKQDIFHHLTCFAGGMFITGALSQRRGNWTWHLDVGNRIAETCWTSYALTATGLGPESMFGEDLTAFDERYLLRPETIESIFYLYRTTHDPRYREIGRSFYHSLESYCRHPTGYTGLKSTNTTNPKPDDLQQSFFLAETLKYLYLLFAADDVIPIEAYVFNTEAHPISARGWGKRAGYVWGQGKAAQHYGVQKRYERKRKVSAKANDKEQLLQVQKRLRQSNRANQVPDAEYTALD